MRSHSPPADLFASFAIEAIPSASIGTSRCSRPLAIVPHITLRTFSVQAVGIPIPGLEFESQPLIDFFTPLVTQPGAQADVALTAFRESARLGPAYASLLAADLDAKRPDESLAFLAMLTSPTGYAPLLGAVRTAPDAALLQQAQTQVELVPESSLLSVSSNFAAPPVRRARPSDTSADALLSPSALLALLRLTVGNASLACVARAVAAALHTSPTDSDDARTRQLEGLLWVLMGCAAQPAMCQRFAALPSLDLAPLLPLLRVLSPALRPTHAHKSTADASPLELAKNQPLTERVLALVYTLCSDSAYSSLLAALRPVLLSGAAAQEAAGAQLLDLAAGPLSHLVPLMPSRLHALLDVLIDCSPFLTSSSSSPSSLTRAPAVVLLLQMVRLPFAFVSGCSHVAQTATGALQEELAPLMADKPSLLFVLSLLQHHLASALITPSSLSSSSSSSSLVPQLRLVRVACMLSWAYALAPAVPPEGSREVFLAAAVRGAADVTTHQHRRGRGAARA